MSRVSRREWYRRVNSAWPANVPALSADVAVRAAKRLLRYARGRTFRGEVRVTSGNRYTWIRRGILYVNPERGWHSLVHLISHIAEPTHDARHARLELRMIKEVVKRGWLEGKLAVPARAPVVRDRSAERIERLHARIARWESKSRRADNALRKLRRQLKSAERRATQ